MPPEEPVVKGPVDDNDIDQQHPALTVYPAPN
jgi:hypothetical protein